MNGSDNSAPRPPAARLAAERTGAGKDTDAAWLAAPSVEPGDWRDRLVFGPIRIAAMVLPLALSFGFAAWTWQKEERGAYERAERTVGLLHEHLARTLEVKDTLFAAAQARTAGMTWPEIAASREVWTMLRAMTDAASHTSEAGMVDPQGMLVQMSAFFPAPALQLGDRDYVAAVRAADRNRAFMGVPIEGRANRRRAISYARPRLGPDGRPDGGVLWTSLRPDAFTTLFDRVTEPDDMVALVRDDAAVLVRHPERGDGLHLPDGSVMRGLVARALAAADDEATLRGYGPTPFDGRPRIYAARRIEAVGVSVIFGRSVADIRAAWLRQTLWMLVPAVVISALLLFLTRRGQLAVRRELRAQLQARGEAEQRAAAEAARANMEAMLRHAQRMEVLGQVAAGLVHDFRNTVQAVHSGVMLIERATAQGDSARVREVARLVHDAVDRAGQLTQRLLAQGGHKDDGPPQCDPAETVSATCRLLQSALGPGFRLVIRLEDGLPARVAAGAAELDAALVNLVINARDAMPEGGEIVVAARTGGAGPGLAEGAYVKLSVTDTGAGMDEATLGRATEAFFTTKGQGGTGMGLASIRAFVTQVGGAMVLASAEGQGTTVTLWLPAAPDPPEAAPPDGGDAASGGTAG